VDPQERRYKRAVLVNTTVGVLIATIDSSIVIIAMPSIFAGILSKSIPTAQDAAPQVTNAYYSMLFGRLGWGTVAVGVVLVLLIPFLRRLISDKDTPEVDELAPAVVPH